MMKKSELKQIRDREIKQYKLGSRLAVVFFSVVVIFIVLSFFIIYIAAKLGFSVEHLKTPWTGVFSISMLSILLSSLVSYYLIKKVLSPLEQISMGIQKVGEGDFSVQLSYDGHLDEMEGAVNNFNRMVKELNSVEIMRNDFIADVSHEFKTPLAAITGYATFLQDTELSENEKNEYIHKIFFNIDKLNDLTENILRLSKLEHQQYMEEPVSYRLDEQIREAIVLLEPKWSRKRMELDIDLAETEYLGQKALLFQVWVNVIGNAIKYTDMEGKISVYLRREKGQLQVVVSDNGIGMSEETQAHIFDKFYQGDTSRRSQGNGLGLALCKEIIGRCGGEILVESTIGIGSVFVINLWENR